MTADRQKNDSKAENLDDGVVDLPVISGEFVDVSLSEESSEEDTKISPKNKDEIGFQKTEAQNSNIGNHRYNAHYIFLPCIFLLVALLGGMRIGVKNSEFIFLRPALICLVFAAVLLVLFFRANLIRLDGWFNEKFSTQKNIANGAVIFTLFAATSQIFNALIPEQGLPFWIIAFCFFWTLWNNLFAEFDTKRLLKSLGGLFSLAFVAKYLILANLVSNGQGNWITRIWENPTGEAFTYFLNIPQFASATGYIQFFALGFYLIGLFLVNPDTEFANGGG